MNDLIQTLVVALCVLAAAVWLGRRLFFSMTGRKIGCGCGTKGCSRGKMPEQPRRQHH